jgi:hypothetical protein
VFVPLVLISSISFAKKIVREPQQVGGDVGMRDIEIHDIVTEKADVGTTMSFKGADASSLHAVLPTLASSENPQETTGFIAHDSNRAVVVKCIKNQFSDTRNAYEPVQGGPLCSVTIKEAPTRKAPSALRWIASESNKNDKSKK